MGVSIVTPVYDPPRLFVSQSWGGPLMLDLSSDPPAARVRWRLPAGADVEETQVNCLMSTPILRDGHLYAVALYGALRCLRQDDGARVWETHAATGRGRWWNAFLTPQADRVFLANEQGELIIARLTPAGYEELSRARLIDPTAKAMRRDIVWSHPAYANRCIYARNDREILCVSLAAPAASRPH
jgi:outer membrane protein assembly factor BamB